MTIATICECQVRFLLRYFFLLLSNLSIYIRYWIIYETFAYIHVSSFPRDKLENRENFYNASIHFSYLSSSRSTRYQLIKFRLHVFHVIAEMCKYEGFLLLLWRIHKNILMESEIRGISRSYANLLSLQKLWRSDEAMEVAGPVRVVHQYVNMPEQSAEFYNETTGKLEEVNNGCRP